MPVDMIWNCMLYKYLLGDSDSFKSKYNPVTQHFRGAPIQSSTCVLEQAYTQHSQFPVFLLSPREQFPVSHICGCANGLGWSFSIQLMQPAKPDAEAVRQASERCRIQACLSPPAPFAIQSKHVVWASCQVQGTSCSLSGTLAP